MAKGILFNTNMVRAILDGRKTVTRRVIKVPRYYPHFYKLHENTDRAITGTPDRLFAGFYKDEQIFYLDGEKHIDAVYYKAPYQPDDIIYVRETWGKGYEDGTYIYRADDRLAELQPFKQSPKLIYRPSIHMPREAARIWLKVTDVRVERLQDISNEQIFEEGCDFETIKHYIKQMPEETEEWVHAAHAVEFSQLWDSTIKKLDVDRYGYDANPWVWVIEFERCEKPERLLLAK